MDSFVSARIPVETKTKASKILAALGATHSDLVNAAYEFLLKTEALPSCPKEAFETRHLSEEQAARISEIIRSTTIPIPESAWEGKDYKSILSEGRRADYEALS